MEAKGVGRVWVESDCKVSPDIRRATRNRNGLLSSNRFVWFQSNIIPKYCRERGGEGGREGGREGEREGGRERGEGDRQSKGRGTERKRERGERGRE